jgi:hypothetical protein
MSNYTGFNTITALQPLAFSAMQKVPREMTGLVSSVNADFDDKMASVGDPVKVPIIGQGSTRVFTPGMTTTAAVAQTPTTVTFSLTDSLEYPWQLTSEEELSLRNGGDNALEFMRQNIEQGIRTLVNGMSTKLFGVAYKGASRYVGTPGTNPFYTSSAQGIGAIADAMQILADNGFQVDGQHSLVLGSAALFGLMKNVTINNQPLNSPAADILEMGTYANLFGAKIKGDAAIGLVTAGGGTTYAINGTQAIGTTSLTIKTGTMTVNAGDLFTYASDTSNKYVNNVQLVGAGNLTLTKPGIRIAATANDAVTINATNFTPNICLHRSAIALKVRPQMLTPGNKNIESTVITDPVTGLSFQFSKVYGDSMTQYRIQCVYGYQVVQGEAIAILAG